MGDISSDGREPGDIELPGSEENDFTEGLGDLEEVEVVDNEDPDILGYDIEDDETGEEDIDLTSLREGLAMLQEIQSLDEEAAEDEPKIEEPEIPETKEPEPEVEEPEIKAPEVPAPDLSNPNKMMTAEEIAALLQNM
jgi:hypothetical protein